MGQQRGYKNRWHREFYGMFDKKKEYYGIVTKNRIELHIQDKKGIIKYTLSFASIPPSYFY